MTCDDGEEVSRLRLRYPKHLMSSTIPPPLQGGHPSFLHNWREERERWVDDDVMMMFNNLFKNSDDDVYYYNC